ncbi:MAG: PAS domain-containing protein [Planctomycetota bacterium]|nr:MAG: PAS domain-containing protein [Planctomycetota bacterium]
MFEPMSPARFAPFDGLPGVGALARDESFRLVWCNEEYAHLCGRDRVEDMVGTTLFDLMPLEQARERAEHMRPALSEGRMVAYQQMWNGARWLTRVWPLDPEAFGHEGYFVMLRRLTDPIPESANPEDTVEFIRTAHLGDLSVLSPRELEVYYYLASGMTVSDIAETLFRSDKTIGRHVENIHKKMGYTNRAELVRDAVQRGLIHFTGRQWLELVDPRHADG